MLPLVPESKKSGRAEDSEGSAQRIGRKRTSESERMAGSGYKDWDSRSWNYFGAVDWSWSGPVDNSKNVPVGEYYGFSDANAEGLEMADWDPAPTSVEEAVSSVSAVQQPAVPAATPADPLRGLVAYDWYEDVQQMRLARADQQHTDPAPTHSIYMRQCDAPKDPGWKPEAEAKLIKKRRGWITERYMVKDKVYNLLVNRFGQPEVEVFADTKMHRLATWWGPGGVVEDAFQEYWAHWWRGLLWWNPPFSRLEEVLGAHKDQE